MSRSPNTNSSTNFEPEKIQPAASPVTPYAYSVRDACRMLGSINRSTFYRHVKSGKLSTRKLGSRTVVMASEIVRLLESLPSPQDK